MKEKRKEEKRKEEKRRREEKRRVEKRREKNTYQPLPSPGGNGPVKYWVKNHSQWSAFAIFRGCHTPRGPCQIVQRSRSQVVMAAIWHSSRDQKKGEID
jgi:hypothetical protein